MSSTTTTLAELPSLKGQVLGVSEWLEVTQDRVNTFADATDDHQWIHVDAERADGRVPVRRADRARVPHPVALRPDVVADPQVTDVTMGVNYGLNKVRFPAPVPVGSKIRLVATLLDVEEVKGGVQLIVGGVIEREGSDKPVCVLESLTRLYG